MLTNTIIKGCNCIEHVLCNILLNMGLDYSMLFTDSWSIFVRVDAALPLRDRLDIYHSSYYELFENLRRYYGIDDKWQARPNNYQELQSLIQTQGYLCLRVPTEACSWLISIDGMEEYHYLLIASMEDQWLYVYDYSSTIMKRLNLEMLLKKGNIELIAFHRTQDIIHAQNYEQDLIRKLNEKAEKRRLSENIRLLTKELDDATLILSELSYSDLIVSPLLRKISYLGFGRQNFLTLFQRRNLIEKYNLEEECKCLLEISKKWLFLNKLFTKFALSSKAKILQKIKRYLEGISIEEEELLDRFLAKMR